MCFEIGTCIKFEVRQNQYSTSSLEVFKESQVILTSTLCPFPLILGATVFHFEKLYYAIIGGSVAEWFISALDSQSGQSQVQVPLWSLA